MLSQRFVAGGPVNVVFPSKPLPCSTCLEANIAASKTPPTEVENRRTLYPGQVLRIDNLGPLSPVGMGYPYVNMITDAYTGAMLAATPLENKAQTALHQEVMIKRAHRSAAPLGGTQHLELDNGTDVASARTLTFAKNQGMTSSTFVPNRAQSRGGVERPHREWKRKMRWLQATSDLPPEHTVYLFNHARRLYNMTASAADPTKSKHEHYYKSKPEASALLHTFGAAVVILRLPKPPGLQPRGVRGRWYGLAGDGNSIHFVAVRTQRSPGAPITEKVVISRTSGSLATRRLTLALWT
jgi:hypothetical protein